MKSFSVTEIPLRGRNMVDASAGTGKTYAIATLFVRLLLETEHHPSQILVVTFTEAATAELRGRVRARLRECLEAARSAPVPPPTADPTLIEILSRAGDTVRSARRLEQALYEFDKVEISTIHGFCQRVLMERAFQTDVAWGSELYGDARPVIDDLVLDYWATVAGPAQPEFLAHMRKGSKFGLDAARGLAYTVQRTPEGALVPASAGHGDPPDFERFRAEYRRVRQVWQRHDVLALLAGSKVKKQSYNRRHTPRWVKAVSQFFAGEPSLFSKPPDSFERFCSARLAQAGGDDLCTHELVLACDALLAEYQRLELALEAELLRFKMGLLDFVREGLSNRARQTGQLSFDDLLRRVQQALTGPGGKDLALSVRQRYPAALIDEFQDTDPLQLDIFERIYDAPNVSLFLIGDPKQAIYSFRGADVFSYVAATRRTSPDRRYGMTTNYRSDPSLVAAVNHLFESSAHPFLLPEIGFQSVRPRPGSDDGLTDANGNNASGLVVAFADSGEAGGKPLEREWELRKLPEFVASDIQAALAGGLVYHGVKVAPADIAVLTRTNDQAFLIQAALRARGVLSVVLGDKSVYASAEARDVERVLSAVLEPSSTRLVRAAITTELLGVSAPELWALDEDEAAWERWLRTFHELAAIWSQTGFVQMCRVMLSRCVVEQRLLALGDGERRLTNVFQLIELLHAASCRGHLGPSGLLSFLKRERRRRVVGVEAEAAQIRLESDAAAVKITTMHKSKGLEYPVVYCPYLWSGTLLHASDARAPKFHQHSGQLAIDIGSPDLEANKERAGWEQFAENLRLAYVALTRARHRCTVYWGRIRSFATSPLGYLLHPPPAGDGPPSVSEIKQHLGSLDDATMLAELERHSGAASIAIERVALRQSPLRDESDTSLPAPAFIARKPERAIDDRYRTSSFSALTRDSELTITKEVDEHVRDHDAAARPAESPAAREQSEPPIRLFEFPRGAKAGSFFHDVLEHHDFASARPGALPKLVETRLGSYRYPVDTWRELVCQQVWGVLDTPLHATGEAEPLFLGKVSLAERLSELEFCLPVGGSPEQRRPLEPSGLARAFREHPSPLVPARYADDLARLRFVPLEGFLRGFIDLVFRKGDRYYLVDYKANHLGVHASDYGAAALGVAMMEGQYFLQYHLYALALHRHLALRVPGYDYERNFGGVFYLFIKGMGPDHGSSGVFFEKPPQGRLLSLSRALEQP